MKKIRFGYLLANPILILFFLVLDLAGALVFSFKRKKTLPSAPQKILIAKIDHLGDVLMSLHALPAIKKAFPNSKIHYLAGSWARMLLENHPAVDRVYSFDHFLLSRGGSFLQRWDKMWEDLFILLPVLRNERYDLAFDFRAYFPNFIPGLALVNAKYKVGFKTGGFGFLLDAVPPWRAGIHETEHFFDLLRAVAPEVQREPSDLSYLAHRERTDQFLDAQGVGPGKFCVIHAFCRKSFLYRQKHWKMAEWKKVVLRLETDGYQVLCTGDKEDESLIAEMTAGMRAKNLAGMTPLPILCGILGRAQFTVCVDTFVSHLSAALGVATVVLFNAVEPSEQWKPWGPKVKILPIESNSEDVISALPKPEALP